MKFECDQDWNAMRPTTCGRFCDMCKKEVFDFTGKSIAEVNRVKAEKGEVCGMFLAEQVEQDLFALNFPLFTRAKMALAAVATFFGLQLNNAQAAPVKPKPPIELSPVSNDHETSIEERLTGPDGHPTGRDSRGKRKVKLSKKSTKDAVKKKKKIYFTKTFPFIKIKKRRRMRVGKF